MRSLREPGGATIADAYWPGSGFALGAVGRSMLPVGTAVVTPNGVHGMTFWHPSQPSRAAASPMSKLSFFPILIINVEASARLPTEQAGLDQVPEHRAGAILRIAEVAVENLCDRQHGIEP